MTSGIFHSIPIPSITVLREERQRRKIDDIDSLAASIQEVGLISPIIVTRNGQLVAGERRLSACKRLGWTHISSQYTDEIDPAILTLIELEENVRRKDITWQERTLAIEKYHRLKRESDPTWTHEQTARALNTARNSVTEHLLVAHEITEPLVFGAATFKTAIEKAAEVSRRRDDSILHTCRPATPTHSPILTADFIEWSSSPHDKFNFIHCDFPYGINSTGAAGQRARDWIKYDDKESTYWELFKALSTNLDNFCAIDAHIIFWFSPNLYCQTWEMLKLLDGFTFEEHPLIWYRGISNGIAPDPYRRPRRSYETAFFGWRGAAQILHVKENLYYATTHRTNESHPSEKSTEALTHFFSMFVNEYTRLLDPTCGSGSALRAAKSLGATVFGIEQNEEFADVARRTLRDSDTTSAGGGDNLP